MVTEQSTGLVRINNVDPRLAVAPRNLDDVHSMATTVQKAGLYGVKTIEEAKIRMVTGMELGLSMLQSLRGVFVMSANGKNQPGLYADTMVALCKSHAEICEYFTLVESSGKVAVYRTKRRGDPEPVTMAFTMEQARAASLAGKDVWKSYPDAMLRARAATALARAVYPDLLNGLYSVEELRDMGAQEPPRHVVESLPPKELMDGTFPQPEKPEPDNLEQQLRESIEEQQKVAHQELRMLLTNAANWASLDDAGALISGAWTTKKLTREAMTDLVAYGKKRRGELKPPAEPA